MIQLKKTGLLMLLPALCAALLCACGGTGVTETEAEAPEAAQIQASQETAAPEEAADIPETDGGEAAEAAEPSEGSQEGASGFDAAALTEALNDVCAVAPGTAGSSLRAMRAANELVVFAAQSWSEDSDQAIRDCVSAWFDALDEEEKAVFHEGRELMETQAESLVQMNWSPEVLEAQQDAGVEPVPSTLDLSRTAGLLDAIRGCTGAVTEND